MPTASTSHLPPPKSWDEFEDICADLFSREWDDPNATRYGRQGQRQNGVDIYGTPRAQSGIAGVQCKGRRAWPPPALKTGDIDEEIAKAKSFKPSLSSLTIATTAPDDARVQDHVRAITHQHARDDLFAVHVVGWGELTRRLTQHDDLVEKHYGHVGFASLRKEIQDLPARTADLVVAKLSHQRVPALSSTPQPATGAYDVFISHASEDKAARPELQDSAERDLTRRYRVAWRRHLFSETAQKDEFSSLGLELLEGLYGGVDPSFRRTVLLRAARSAAAHNRVADAHKFLAAAENLAGAEPLILAQARIADAEGKTDEAIRLLRDLDDPDSRGVLLSILDRRNGTDAALDWWHTLNLPVSALRPVGVYALTIIHIKKELFDAAKRSLDGLPAEVIDDTPALLFVRTAIRLACLFAKPERADVLGGIPVDLRRYRPILMGNALAVELDAAASDLHRLLPVLTDLGLEAAARVANQFLLWCDLLHPIRNAAAVATLRQEMADERPPLEKLSLALSFVPEFEASPIAQYLEARDKFGGLDDNELFALLILQLHDSNAQSTVEFVARFRERLGTYLSPQALLSLEIQALAKAGNAAVSRKLFTEKRDELDPVMVATLEAEVEKAEGTDPVAAYRHAHAAANTEGTLRALIDAFVSRSDHRSVAEHALQLYARTQHPDDITFALTALGRAGSLEELVALVDSHSFVLEKSCEVARRYAWELFRQGRLKDVRTLLDRFAAGGIDQRELNLEIALAIETGNWEAVSQPLEIFRAHPERFDARDIMRAANVARATGQSAYRELVRLAIQRDGEDASILVGAYAMTLEDGSDDSGEAQLWFQKALALSGPDGPLKSVELKEIIRQQKSWNEHSQKLNQHITRGEIPLAIAAKGLGTTAVDVVLRNLIRSEQLIDARRRTALPLFSGRRKVAAIGTSRRAAFDTSALLVLGWLDLLPASLELFPEIVLASGAMQELFEGSARLQQFQRSRLTAAAQIRDAILHKGLKQLPTYVPCHDPLAKDIGKELASLLYAAEKMNGVVLRPAPVHRTGLENKDADLAAHAARLADMHALLAVLGEESAIDGVAESTAKKYFTLQDRKWPSAAKPNPSQPLLIDGLALIYLQTTGLLDAVLRTFKEVYVDASAGDEATALLDYGKQLDTLSAVVNRIRKAVHNAFASGKVIVSPRRGTKQDDEDDIKSSATLNLIADLKQADIVVFDDRMLNAEAFTLDDHAHQARTVTSLDLIEELRARAAISIDERRQYRNRLRRGGAALVPVDAEEIEYAASRSTRLPSPEFRAIRDSFDLARVGGIARFPAEIPWFASLCTETKHAIVRAWKNHPDRAEAISYFILELRPIPEDWVDGWEGAVPPNWPDAIHRVMAFGLTLPIELTDAAVIARYNAWLEETVLAAERELRPSRIVAVADHLRELIVGLAKGTFDDEE